MERILPGLFSIVLIQSWLFGIIFIYNGRKKSSYYFLSLFLFLYSSGNIPWLLKSLGLFETHPKLKHLPLGFFFMIAPVFYLLARKVIGVFRKKDLAHLLPGLVEASILFIVFFIGDKARNWLYVENRQLIEILYVFIWPLYSIAYFFLTIFLVNNFQPLIPEVYSNTTNKQIRWIKLTAMILIASYVIEFIAAYFTVFSPYGSYVVYFSLLVNFFVIYWISISGLRQQELQLPLTSEKPVRELSTDPDEALQFNELESLIRDRSLFTNKDLTLFTLAEESGLQYREVSRLVNTYSGKNFSQFINQFRIEAAKKILSDGSMDHLNLSGIADQVGFNSRSSFFTSFKQITGTTPMEFKKLNSSG